MKSAGMLGLVLLLLTTNARAAGEPLAPASPPVTPADADEARWQQPSGLLLAGAAGVLAAGVLVTGAAAAGILTGVAVMNRLGVRPTALPQQPQPAMPNRAVLVVLGLAAGLGTLVLTTATVTGLVVWNTVMGVMITLRLVRGVVRWFHAPAELGSPPRRERRRRSPCAPPPQQQEPRARPPCGCDGLDAWIRAGAGG